MHSSEGGVHPDSEYFLHTPGEKAKSLFFYPVVIGKYDYLAGYRLVRSRYDSFLILLVEEGEMELTLGGPAMTVPAGSIALIDCYVPHEYGTKNGASTLWLHFDGPLARAYFDAIREERGCILIPAGYPGIRRRLLDLYRSFQKGQIPGEASLSLDITALLQELMVESTVRPTSSEGIGRATRYLTEHFARKITLEELAAQAGFSPYYFTRLFKKETGLTPHQYLIATRIAAARYNLSNTGLSVAEVAASCGFEDESAFISAFRKREGVTPAKYRKSAYSLPIFRGDNP